MTKGRIIAFGVLVTLLLGFLAAGVWTTEFRGGRPFSFDFWARGDVGSIPAGDEQILRFLLRALHILLLVSLLLVFVVFVLVPEYRRRIVRLLLATALLALIAFLILNALFHTIGEQPMQQEQPTLGQGTGEGEGTPVERAPSAPEWVVYLVATVAGALLAWWGIGRFYGRIRFQETVNEQLSQAAREAAAELRAGRPVSDVVVRCWVRMVDILSQRAQVRDSPHLTPEELARELSRRGFSHEGILKLTRLFEEVRYGHKESEARREEAIAALSAIERVYG